MSIFEDHGVCTEVITDSVALERAIHGRYALVQTLPSALLLANRRKNTRCRLCPASSHQRVWPSSLGLGHTWSVRGDIFALVAAVNMFITIRPKINSNDFGGFWNQLADSNSNFLVAEIKFFERFEFFGVFKVSSHTMCGRTCACAVACLHPHNSSSNVIVSVTIPHGHTGEIRDRQLGLHNDFSVHILCIHFLPIDSIRVRFSGTVVKTRLILRCRSNGTSHASRNCSWQLQNFPPSSSLMTLQLDIQRRQFSRSPAPSFTFFPGCGITTLPFL